MDGKPILEPKKQKQRTMNEEVASMEQFILAGPEQMKANVKTGGGGFLQAIMTGSSGAEAGPNGPQQIISVDGVLLVTKYAGKGRTEDLVKNYFAVWRRVEPGTYSSKR